MNSDIKYNLTKKKPPIYDALDREFGISKHKGIIISYAPAIYCNIDNLPEHLIEHEKVHIRQQTEIGVENWWQKFIDDPKFRLDQEVEAYRVQVKWLQENTESLSRNERRGWIKKCAEDLSSGIYGNIISYEQAFNLITKQ